jgi:Tol biopolymer transport system component
MAQAFDPAKGAMLGEPQNLAKGVINDVSTWHMAASATNDGLLVLGSGGSGDVQLLWLDRSGKQVGIVADKLTNLQGARLAPQGDRIALQIDSGMNDIWVLDLVRGVRTRLTFGPVANSNPVWSPDGKWIAHLSKRGDHFDIYRKQSDGSNGEELLVSSDTSILPDSWAHDGKSLVYTKHYSSDHQEIWVVPTQGEHNSRMVIPRGSHGDLSPDGRWLAYQSGESGSFEIYVVPLGGGQGKWQVSSDGGMAPRWSSDGKELYYFETSASGTIFAVPVKDAGGALQFGAAQPLVTGWTILTGPLYDVSPDGKKILLDRIVQQVSPSITVITNFPSILKK